MKKLYCPNCGKQNVKASDSNPNGGELFVAEDCRSSIEFYDDVNPYDCQDCLTRFYMGGVEQ